MLVMASLWLLMIVMIVVQVVIVGEARQVVRGRRRVLANVVVSLIWGWQVVIRLRRCNG